MRLGSSIRRRRFRSDGRFRWPGRKRWLSLGPINLSRDATVVSVSVLVFGLVFGYLVTTRLLFPLPPRPRDLFEVPDVRGLDRAVALEMIERAGIGAAVTDSFRHPTALKGEVLGQTPLAGQLSTATNTVALTVSLGAVRRPVPDVVRLGLSSARTVLEASGFIVVVDTLIAELPPGQVVEVLPSAGTEVDLPMEVIVLVSTGPPLVPMPLLLGLQQGNAEVLLDSLGFELAPIETLVRYVRDQGRVVRQFPPPDSLVAPRSRVTLVVGRRSSGRRGIRN
ncbi:MAG: PASTA domain-containing protein [Gemmatimonadetes bacterium]|nr:PASTA domain-containing protein [Gemmatimonadota bacterium]